MKLNMIEYLKYYFYGGYVVFRIIPQPVSIKPQNDKKGFSFNDVTISDMPAASELINFAKTVLNKNISVCSNGKENIILKTDESFENEEGYTISCAEGTITVTAKIDTGIFYAIQTLKQIFLQSADEVPAFEIEDNPRFSYRGYLLDCGRYFYSVEDVKRVVDFLALHKFNVLHWHLTEDQGWRIEIKKYPLLTQKGSKRSHTNFNHKPHGGFYTQKEIKEIVAYCHEKHIKVIPEFDIPGHNVSSIACYPYLACFERELDVATHWGVKRDILCAGKETTYQFVYDILDEIMELFPDKIIHIGGDEAFKERWKLCPNCQKAIKENNLRDENDLQMFFMTKIDKYLQSKGYSSIMWSNDTKGGTETLSPDIAWTVYLPENLESAIKPELERGRKLINAKNKPYYLDFPYGWVSLKDVCDDSGALTDNDSDTMGLEACMWTEYVPDMKKLEFLTFPRLGAISEKAWSPKGSSTFSTFKDKTDVYYKLLDAHKIGYAPMNKACPSFFYKHASSVWFKRRVFHWEGLHIALDNKKVEKLAKKQ